MSLLLNGAKTVTIAGTEMQCLEIYTGESYTLPLTFTDSSGNPINCTIPNTWTLTTSAKFYTATDITYVSDSDIVMGNLTLNVPQPSTGVGTYSPDLQAQFSNAANGTGYLFIPPNLTGGTGSPNATPVISLANNTANSTVIVVTLQVARQSVQWPLYADINKEPIGLIVRYQ